VRLCAVAVLALLVGCYDVPTPVCGFSCVQESECPDGYTCNSSDRFCHLNGSLTTCPGHEDLDSQAPFVASVTPNPGLSFDPTSVIIVRFSEEVTGVNSDSFFARTSTGEAIDTIVTPLGSANYELTASLGSFPIGDFTVTLTSAIRDSSFNPLDELTFMYSSQVPGPPQLLSSVPSISETNVSVGVELQLNFDKPAPNILDRFSFVDQQNTPVTFFYEPTSGTQNPIFRPRWQLTQNTQYIASIAPGLMDAAGHATTVGTAIVFDTGLDTVGPRIFARTPGFFDVNVSVGTVIELDFDEDALDVIDGTITLQKNGVGVPGKLTYNPASRIATFHPDDQLEGFTNYDVVITTGITDQFGNVTPETGSSFETTNDAVAPRIRLAIPKAGSSGAPVTTSISMTFDEPTFGLSATTVFVNAGVDTITGTLASTDGSRTWTFTPDAPLPAMTEVDVDVEVAQDAIGNSANYFYSFTTAP
jgi:hypothetical protein